MTFWLDFGVGGIHFNGIENIDNVRKNLHFTDKKIKVFFFVFSLLMFNHMSDIAARRGS